LWAARSFPLNAVVFHEMEPLPQLSEFELVESACCLLHVLGDSDLLLLEETDDRTDRGSLQRESVHMEKERSVVTAESRISGLAGDKMGTMISSLQSQASRIVL
jgi:hypothetical protein